MFYKYSIWTDDGEKFFSNVTSERKAIAAIIRYYSISSSTARKMWVKNNETGMLIGIVNKRSRGYTYETDKGERYVNTDGTFMKKTSKGNQFGLDFYLGK